MLQIASRYAYQGYVMLQSACTGLQYARGYQGQLMSRVVSSPPGASFLREEDAGINLGPYGVFQEDNRICTDSANSGHFV